MSDDDLRTLITDWLNQQEGDFIPSVLAGKLAAHLRETQPQVLQRWLDENAERFLTHAMAQWLSGYRAKVQHRAKARAFAEITDDLEALSHFAVVYEIDVDHTRRRVADMVGVDHGFVADAYGRSGTYDLMLEAFHRAVAKKCGKRTTADVFTEDQYDEMFRSIVRPE